MLVWLLRGVSRGTIDEISINLMMLERIVNEACNLHRLSAERALTRGVEWLSHSWRYIWRLT